ncbi:hypothetical protein R1flu_017813 [Riccia fluitans]|uniref:PROP1-like PPR domain-containing protein n=1 Tax=Riccia fluitans TaxID=41844 RepID=A0ABD1ZFB8_9MARC
MEWRTRGVLSFTAAEQERWWAVVDNLGVIGRPPQRMLPPQGPGPSSSGCCHDRGRMRIMTPAAAVHSSSFLSLSSNCDHSVPSSSSVTSSVFCAGSSSSEQVAHTAVKNPRNGLKKLSVKTLDHRPVVQDRRGVGLGTSVSSESGRKSLVPLLDHENSQQKDGQRSSKALLDSLKSGMEMALPRDASPAELEELISRVESSSSALEVDLILSRWAVNAFGLKHMNSLLTGVQSEDRIVDVFTWMRRNGKTRNNLYACRTVLKVLTKRKAWGMITELLDEVGSTLDHLTWNIVIDDVVNAGVPELAFKFISTMAPRGFRPQVSTFVNLLRLFQKTKKVSEAESVFRMFEGNEYRCCSAYSAMISIYTRAGLYRKAEKIIQDMENGDITPDKDSWLMQINAFGQQGKVREAERKFLAMQEAQIKPDLLAYNSMILAYGRAHLFDRACSTFTKMKDVGITPDESTYRSMIGACGRAGKLKDALKLFSEMKNLNYHPSLQNYNTLINLYGKVRNGGGIVRVLQEMKEVGIKADSQTLDAALRAMERSGKLKNLGKLLSSLKEAGWSADTTSCIPLLGAYIKCNMNEAALETFKVMRQAALIPKESVCLALICQCKDAGKLEDAVHLFHELQAAGISPGLETTCTMINVYGILGKVEEAEGLFNKLRESGVKLDLVAYNCLLSVYMRAGMLEKAKKVFQIIEEHPELNPDAYSFQSMLRVLQKVELEKEGTELYWKILDLGVELDEGLLTCIINCCGRALPLEETAVLFQALLDRGCTPNSTTFNLMMDIYGKAGMLDRTRHVYELARQCGMVDKVTYSTLIDAYGKCRDFPNMERTLWDMQRNGFACTLEAYNAMIDAYGKAGMINKMEDVLERMRRAGCRADLSTYNILINILGKRGLWQDVQNVLMEMKEQGWKPDVWTYNTLIRAYGLAEMPDEVVRVFKEMQDVGLMPDRITYVNLVAAFEKSGNLLEAASSLRGVWPPKINPPISYLGVCDISKFWVGILSGFEDLLRPEV